MPPNRLALIEKQSPLSIINMQTHKGILYFHVSLSNPGIAQHQINSNYFSTQTHILRENTVNQATLTNICGVDVEIINNNQADVNMAIPMFDKDTQVSFGKAETTEQITETGIYILF